MRRDFSISFIRVCAMWFIVICHVANYFGLNALAQFFNVGIPIFFIISGYLYGDKEIKQPGFWLYKRYIRLEVPALIWLFIICVSAFLRNQKLPELHECIFLLLDLQGLKFIFSTIKDLFIGPWFFTNIMCCYILLLCYLRIEKKHPEAFHLFDYGGIIPLSVFVLLAMCRISTDGALAFFIGFCLKRKKLLEKNIKFNIIPAVAYFTVAVALRLIGKRYIDGSVFYDEVIAPVTHVMIAAAFVVGIKWLFEMSPIAMNRVASSYPILHLDRISIYVYISHTMLFGGIVLSVFKWPLPVLILMVLFVVFVIAFSTLLWYVGEWLTKQIDRVVSFLFV